MTKLTDLSTNIDSRIKRLAAQIPNYAGKDSELAKLLDILADGIDNYRAEVQIQIDGLASDVRSAEAAHDKLVDEQLPKWRERVSDTDRQNRDIRAAYDSNVAELKALALLCGRLEDENKALKDNANEIGREINGSAQSINALRKELAAVRAHGFELESIAGDAQQRLKAVCAELREVKDENALLNRDCAQWAEKFKLAQPIRQALQEVQVIVRKWLEPGKHIRARHAMESITLFVDNGPLVEAQRALGDDLLDPGFDEVSPAREIHIDPAKVDDMTVIHWNCQCGNSGWLRLSRYQNNREFTCQSCKRAYYVQETLPF